MVDQFEMKIKVSKLPNGDIDVRDSVGIRLHLLNEVDSKGLWTYFSARLDQYNQFINQEKS